jgi:hypothetical protein
LQVTHFERALKSLIEDPNYRNAVTEDWSRLIADFNELDPHELLLLMQVWNATGHDEAAESAITLCRCCCGRA